MKERQDSIAQRIAGTIAGGMRRRQQEREPRALVYDAAGEPHRGLGTADDLDVLPREGAGDPEAERLAHGLLAREAAGVALGGVGARVAVPLLGRREAALAKALVPRERASHALDLDQVGADVDQRCSSSQSGRWLIDETIPSGRARDASTSSGRNLPVRTSTVRIPIA